MARSVQLSFDAEHPAELLRFWCAVLGYEPEPLHPAARAELERIGIDPESSGRMFAAAVDPDGVGPRLLAQRVPEGKTAKNRLHLDVRIGGAHLIDAEVERLVGLGATAHGRFSEHGSTWQVMTDPEGNEFCVG